MAKDQEHRLATAQRAKACTHYSRRAVTEVRKAKDEDRCTFNTTIWSKKAEDHKRACIGAKDYKAYIRQSNDARQKDLNQCRLRNSRLPGCEDFSDKLKAQIRIARQNGCDRLGNRWAAGRKDLQQQCMRTRLDTTEILMNREKRLERCLASRTGTIQVDDPGKLLGIVGLLVANELLGGSSLPQANFPSQPEKIQPCEAGQVMSRSGQCQFPVEVVGRDVIRQDQVCLRLVGFDAGKPDGIAGKLTKAAVRNYLGDRGLHVQDGLYSSAREQLHTECGEALALIRGEPEPVESEAEVSCLSFDQWDAYIRRGKKPPLKLCE